MTEGTEENAKGQLEKEAVMGKPEPLKGNMKGWWSRRIDETNRIADRKNRGTAHIEFNRFSEKIGGQSYV